MKSRYERQLALIQRRLELLRSLLRIQSEWRRAFVGLDMKASERFAMDEELVCRQIMTLDREIASAQQAGPTPSPGRPGISESTDPDEVLIAQGEIRAALREMSALHAALHHSNQVRQAILRRSIFTLRALRNLFNSYAPTYAAPAVPHRGALCEENV